MACILEAPSLSTASNIVFITSNLAGIPQYSVDQFEFPNYVCSDISKLNRDFFGATINQIKIPLANSLLKWLVGKN